MIRKLYVAGIKTDSLVNGDGLRYTIFFQGCPHHCYKCQNQHTWAKGTNKNSRVYTVEELYNDIKRNEDIHKKKVTFSGGEPFAQSEALFELVQRLFLDDYNIWCYTGYIYETLMGMIKEPIRGILSSINVLVDGRFNVNQKCDNVRYIGSSNQRIMFREDVEKDGYNFFTYEDMTNEYYYTRSDDNENIKR